MEYPDNTRADVTMEAVEDTPHSRREMVVAQMQRHQDELGAVRDRNDAGRLRQEELEVMISACESDLQTLDAWINRPVNPTPDSPYQRS